MYEIPHAIPFSIIKWISVSQEILVSNQSISTSHPITMLEYLCNDIGQGHTHCVFFLMLLMTSACRTIWYYNKSCYFPKFFNLKLLSHSIHLNIHCDYFFHQEDILVLFCCVRFFLKLLKRIHVRRWINTFFIVNFVILSKRSEL